ncbi:MAG: hypothetical protein WBV53_08760 [Solirubrobacterales bacterium]
MRTEVAQHTSGHKPWVAPGFEDVRDEFDRNFAARGEIGAAVAAYWRGEKVVDLRGGRRTPTGDDPWNEDTAICSTIPVRRQCAMRSTALSDGSPPEAERLVSSCRMN